MSLRMFLVGIDIVELLVQSGSEVNGRDDKGVIPLHFAAVNGFKECCRVLLLYGSYINAMEYGEDVSFVVFLSSADHRVHRETRLWTTRT
jgi:ankyrin repeat protein